MYDKHKIQNTFRSDTIFQLVFLPLDFQYQRGNEAMQEMRGIWKYEVFFIAVRLFDI